MDRTKWIESLKPTDKVIHVWHDLTKESVSIIEIKKYNNETLVKVIAKKQSNLFAHWVNVETLIEPTDGLHSEIELEKKRDSLKNCIWENVVDIKIHSVYGIVFGDSK